jgi:hypothetical protein
MAFVAQTFSVGEILAAAKMNQIDTNIDEVRKFHKGNSAPDVLIAGIQWIDDTSSPWTWKVYDGTDWISIGTIDPAENEFSSAGGGGFTLGTKIDTTSGTSATFTGIPSGTKQIVISFVNVSTNGSSEWHLRLGDSGGVETTGYTGGFIEDITPDFDTVGFGVVRSATTAGNTYSGQFVFSLVDEATNTWCMSGGMTRSVARMNTSAGSKALSSELTQLSFITLSGDTLDGGFINIQYQ